MVSMTVTTGITDGSEGASLTA